MDAHIARAAAAVGAQAAIHDSAFADDALVTQPTLKMLAGGVSDMTLWRWRRAGVIPEPTSIRGRNYWRAGDVRELLARLAGGAS